MRARYDDGTMFDPHRGFAAFDIGMRLQLANRGVEVRAIPNIAKKTAGAHIGQERNRSAVDGSTAPSYIAEDPVTIDDNPFGLTWLKSKDVEASIFIELRGGLRRPREGDGAPDGLCSDAASFERADPESERMNRHRCDNYTHPRPLSELTGAYNDCFEEGGNLARDPKRRCIIRGTRLSRNSRNQVRLQLAPPRRLHPELPIRRRVDRKVARPYTSTCRYAIGPRVRRDLLKFGIEPLLLDHKAKQDKVKESVGLAYRDNDLVFCNPVANRGRQIRSWVQFRKIAELVGLKGFASMICAMRRRTFLTGLLTNSNA